MAYLTFCFNCLCLFSFTMLTLHNIMQCTQVHPINAATFGHPFEIITKERSHILVRLSLTCLTLSL